MWIRSGDIRDQSRELSEIAQNFGRFFCHPKFLGASLPEGFEFEIGHKIQRVGLNNFLSLLPRGTSTEKVS